MKPIVYFIKEITPANILKIYQALGITLKGNIALKIHSGEEGNKNYLRPNYMVPLINELHPTIVECNTAYEGSRNETSKHLKTIQDHGFDKICNVDLMDSEGEIALKVENGYHLDVNYVGSHIKNYDSMLVLSHFKGHPMGGYGGALKQLSIGCASGHGKAYIHGVKDVTKIWTADHDSFLESMVDAAKTVLDLFDGQIAFINVINNLSVDCDCCSEAEDPCMKDIGIVASLDPVAIDQACIDLVKASNDPGLPHFMERVNSLNGLHTIDEAAKAHLGSKEYTLEVIK